MKFMSFRRKDESVLVPVDMSDAQARRARARAHEVRVLDANAKSRKPYKRKTPFVRLCEILDGKHIISRRYELPEPNVHIFYMPCYTMSPNEKDNLLSRYGTRAAKMVGVAKQRAREEPFTTFATYLPDWCVDKRGTERGSAKALRHTIRMIVITRVSANPLDQHDNLRTALKPVIDGTCAWIVDGPLANRRRIGDYDDELLYSTMNPRGRVELVYAEQEIRRVPHDQVGEFGVRLELHCNEF